MFKSKSCPKLEKFHVFLENLVFLPTLLARVSIGWVFLTTGWGKLHNLDRIVGYFESLGIPLAHIQAPFVSSVELLGGALLILGLGTRYAAAFLAGIMGVALMTAHAKDIDKLSDLFKIYEFVYIIVLGYLSTLGGGRFSLDHLIKKIPLPCISRT